MFLPYLGTFGAQFGAWCTLPLPSPSPPPIVSLMFALNRRNSSEDFKGGYFVMICTSMLKYKNSGQGGINSHAPHRAW